MLPEAMTRLTMTISVLNAIQNIHIISLFMNNDLLGSFAPGGIAQFINVDQEFFKK